MSHSPPGGVLAAKCIVRILLGEGRGTKATRPSGRVAVETGVWQANRTSTVEGVTEEDRRRDGLEAGLRWSWTTLRQIERLHALEARFKADSRRNRPEHYGYEQRLLFWELRSETHFCFVAARNLVRALEYLDPPAEASDFPHLPAGLLGHLQILRDCFEHWDERDPAAAKTSESGRAYRQLAALGVGEAADAYRFGPGDTTVGGLSLDELEATCREVHEYLLELESGLFVWKGWNTVTGTSVSP